jgi:energy-converting hydrogenase Eha subunit G
LRSRALALFIIGAPVVFFLLSGVRAVQLAREGEVPVAWRDLNCDGKVSWAEWLRGGIDFRLRPSQLVPGCQDVYAVNTGRAVVVRCETAPQCRRARDLIK